MNKYLKNLIEISKIDKEQSQLEIDKNNIKKDLDAQINDIKNKKQNVQDLEAELKDYDKNIQKNEDHLKELSDKLNNIAKKSTSVKTEREIKALNLEEDITKEQIVNANNEIDRFEKLKESSKKQIDETSKQIEQTQSDIQQKEKECAKDIEAIEATNKEISKTKEDLIKKVDEKIIAFYEKIKMWANENAISPIQDQCCSGCYLKINNKVYSEIKITQDIITCPHCGRILYEEQEKVA